MTFRADSIGKTHAEFCREGQSVKISVSIVGKTTGKTVVQTAAHSTIERSKALIKTLYFQNFGLNAFVLVSYIFPIFVTPFWTT